MQRFLILNFHADSSRAKGTSEVGVWICSLLDSYTQTANNHDYYILATNKGVGTCEICADLLCTGLKELVIASAV